MTTYRELAERAMRLGRELTPREARDLRRAFNRSTPEQRAADIAWWARESAEAAVDRAVIDGLSADARRRAAVYAAVPAQARRRVT